jgi:hypothetical protein
MFFNIPPDAQRANFLRIQDAVAAATGLPPADVQKRYKMYDNILKLPKLLSPNQSSYTFDPVKGNDQQILPGNNLMDKNDFFAITHVGVRLTRAKYTIATGQLSDYGNYREYTWPYAQIFDGVPAAGATEVACLNTLLRGQLALSVVNDQQWSIPVSELMFCDQNFTGEEDAFQWGASAEERGFFPLSSIIVLDGGADNLLSLTLLSGDTDVIDGNVDSGGDPSTWRNLIEPVLFGVSIKNMANGGNMSLACPRV